ncbi:MAG: Rrf2 family transcriptional regulator, partial [Candidatus Aenigmarchaeota archaeon]|nr:Rrf2 family transcriptional regulator [Candidatus Aenigmarchaeota archaeon]
VENAKANNGIIDLKEIAIKGKMSVAFVEKIMKKLKKKNIVQYINKTWIIKKYLK